MAGSVCKREMVSRPVSYTFLSVSIALEALKIPYVLLSASDPSMKCKKFVKSNLQCPPMHWYRSLADQLEDRGCSEHPGSTMCQAASAEPDLACLGAPCHPFSTQRTSRFDPESVESHPDFGVTMEDAMKLITKHEPKLIVSEQVEGFDKPFVAGGEKTPFTMPLGLEISDIRAYMRT